MALVKSGRCATVLLDVKMSWVLAMVLKDMGMPLLFSTGYALAALLPDVLRGRTFLRKPFKIDDLERSILGVLR